MWCILLGEYWVWMHLNWEWSQHLRFRARGCSRDNKLIIRQRVSSAIVTWQGPEILWGWKRTEELLCRRRISKPTFVVWCFLGPWSTEQCPSTCSSPKITSSCHPMWPKWYMILSFFSFTNFTVFVENDFLLSRKSEVLFTAFKTWIQCWSNHWRGHQECGPSSCTAAWDTMTESTIMGFNKSKGSGAFSVHGRGE